jgi:hypothetical protein
MPQRLPARLAQLNMNSSGEGCTNRRQCKLIEEYTVVNSSAVTTQFNCTLGNKEAWRVLR